MYYSFMSSCIVQYFSFRGKVSLLRRIFVCAASVFAIVSCASQGGGASGESYDTAKVYLTQQGPVPGKSGDFWNGLAGTIVDKRPWVGTAEDANGVFYLAADEKYLYLRAEIHDNAPQARPMDMEIGQSWNGTSLQLFFGTKTSRHSEYEEGDSGLSLWVIDDSDAGKQVLVSSNGRLLNDRQHKGAVIEWAEDSYTLEACFSLDAMGIYKPLKAGQKVRCEFRINHAKLEEPRTVIVNWRTPTDDAWKNPNTWSDGIVIKK